MSEDILLQGLPAISIPDGQYIVYSPYQRAFARISNELVANPAVLSKLRMSGFFSEPRQPAPKSDAVKVVLNITKKCNLFCRYCWAESSPMQKSKMDPKTAINIINKLLTDYKLERIHFMGGEPTTNFRTIRAVTTHLLDASPENLPILYITTNGVMTASVRKWLIAHNFALSVSWDGLRKGNDNQRTYYDGRGAGREVEESICRFVDAGLHLRVRMTVSKLNLPYLYDSVSWLADVGAKYIHIEAVSADGRGQEFAQSFAPTTEEFTDEFYRIVELAEAKGVWLMNSHLANLYSPRDYYCQSLKNRALNFNPDGSISHCYKVQGRNEPLSGHFVVGCTESDGNNIVIDESKSSQLSHHGIKDYPICDDYYLRSFYSGGCPHRNLAATGSSSAIDPTSFSVSRALLRRAILHIYSRALEGKTSALEGYVHFYQALLPNSPVDRTVCHNFSSTSPKLDNTFDSKGICLTSVPISMDAQMTEVDACDICI